MRGHRLKASSSETDGAKDASTIRTSYREQVETEKYCVLADLLIPGKGDPIEHGCIIVEGSKITFAGKADEMESQDANFPKTRVKVLMPGMWDCHVHLMGLQKIDDSAFLDVAHSQALTGARIARDVMLLLNAGFTSVREMAGYGLQIHRGIKEGSIVGPNIYSSNKIIVSSAWSYALYTRRLYGTRVSRVDMPTYIACTSPGLTMLARTACRCNLRMGYQNASKQYECSSVLVLM